jgi:hypothetical protein
MSADALHTTPLTDQHTADELARLRDRVAHLEAQVERLYRLSRHHFLRISNGEDELGPFREGES